jgi:hypothetical protein
VKIYRAIVVDWALMMAPAVVLVGIVDVVVVAVVRPTFSILFI